MSIAKMRYYLYDHHSLTVVTAVGWAAAAPSACRMNVAAFHFFPNLDVMSAMLFYRLRTETLASPFPLLSQNLCNAQSEFFFNKLELN
jgi:hypothetical protein